MVAKQPRNDFPLFQATVLLAGHAFLVIPGLVPWTEVARRGAHLYHCTAPGPRDELGDDENLGSPGDIVGRALHKIILRL